MPPRGLRLTRLFRCSCHAAAVPLQGNAKYGQGQARARGIRGLPASVRGDQAKTSEGLGRPSSLPVSALLSQGQPQRLQARVIHSWNRRAHTPRARTRSPTFPSEDVGTATRRQRRWTTSEGLNKYINESMKVSATGGRSGLGRRAWRWRTASQRSARR